MSRTRVLQNVLLPCVGFGIGWYATSFVTEYKLIGPETQRKVDIMNLKMKKAVQGVLPARVVEKYGTPDAVLDDFIRSLEATADQVGKDARVTFEQVLLECEVPEQMAFLEDHAEESIPYFYIGDVFHSWANIHRKSYTKTEEHEPVAQRNDKRFESRVLCDQLWDKMLKSVIPFDVCVRALCVLAMNNKSNAKRLAAQPGAAPQVLALYAEYQAQLTERANPGGDVVPADDVRTATLQLLRCLNDAQVRRPLVGRGTGPYPLAAGLSADVWCSQFGPKELRAVDTEGLSDGALVFADVLNEKLRCPLD